MLLQIVFGKVQHNTTLRASDVRPAELNKLSAHIKQTRHNTDRIWLSRLCMTARKLREAALLGEISGLDDDVDIAGAPPACQDLEVGPYHRRTRQSP